MDKEQNRLWTVPFILVLFVNALNGISSYMVNPAMPEFLVSKGIPFALTGLISSLLSWVALAMRPFSGAMSDRFNKKKIMFVSYLGDRRLHAGLCAGAKERCGHRGPDPAWGRVCGERYDQYGLRDVVCS